MPNFCLHNELGLSPAFARIDGVDYIVISCTCGAIVGDKVPAIDLLDDMVGT